MSARRRFGVPFRVMCVSADLAVSSGRTGNGGHLARSALARGFVPRPSGRAAPLLVEPGVDVPAGLGASSV